MAERHRTWQASQAVKSAGRLVKYLPLMASLALYGCSSSQKGVETMGNGSVLAQKYDGDKAQKKQNQDSLKVRKDSVFVSAEATGTPAPAVARKFGDPENHMKPLSKEGKDLEIRYALADWSIELQKEVADILENRNPFDSNPELTEDMRWNLKAKVYFNNEARRLIATTTAGDVAGVIKIREKIEGDRRKYDDYGMISKILRKFDEITGNRYLVSD